METSTTPYRVPEVPHPDETVELGGAVEDSKQSWKSTVSATAELLRGVRGSVNAFVPLKSVAGNLCSILENCEVRSSPRIRYHDSYGYPSGRREMNKR